MSIKVEITYDTNIKLHLMIYNTTKHLMNTIRRNILTDVETYCIDKVELKTKYQQGLMDIEELEFRLGQLPINTKLFTEITKNNSEPNVCDLNIINAKMININNVQLDDQYSTIHRSNEFCIPIYASCVKQNSKSIINSIYHDIIIMWVRKNDNFNMHLKIIKGNGKNNSKFIPAFVHLRPIPNIRLSKLLNELNAENKLKFVTSCPTNVFQQQVNYENLDCKIKQNIDIKLERNDNDNNIETNIENNIENSFEKIIPENVISITDVTKCTLCNSCIDFIECENPQNISTSKSIEDIISIQPSTINFEMSIESLGQLPPRTILLNAIDNIISNIDSLEITND